MSKSRHAEAEMIGYGNSGIVDVQRNSAVLDELGLCKLSTHKSLICAADVC